MAEDPASFSSLSGIVERAENFLSLAGTLVPK
jgi:hypothetical protein